MEAMLDVEHWNAAVVHLPGAHMLQTSQWGEVKGKYGWTPSYYYWKSNTGEVNAAAMVLQRSMRLGLVSVNVLYVPRGPLLDWGNGPLRQSVIANLENLAKRRGAIFIKMDPAVSLGTGIPGSSEDIVDQTGCAVEELLRQRRWQFADDQVQFSNTVMIDLTPGEEDMLARMKQKTRYNIRLAEKKGVVVRRAVSADYPELYRMYAETSVRDGFVIRPQEYYETVWQTFQGAGLAYPLIAEVEGNAIAGVIMFAFGGTAWYFYGMSREQHRDKMPNYLLQWEAMRLAKSLGCKAYDLWGAPDEFNETDPMWGVFRFKEGLGGTVLRTLGAWNYVSRPFLFNLYVRVLPKILNIIRRRGKAKTRQEISL